MDGHPRANRQKPSGIAAKEMIGRVHLIPALGHRRLDAIKSEDVQRLKRDLEVKAPKTVNNILTSERAAEEGCRVGRHRADAVLGQASARHEGIPAFHDFAEYERLVDAARAQDRELI